MEHRKKQIIFLRQVNTNPDPERHENTEEVNQEKCKNIGPWLFLIQIFLCCIFLVAYFFGASFFVESFFVDRGCSHITSAAGVV